MTRQLFFAVAVLFFSATVTAQTKGETAAQQKKDSIQLAAIKIKYPDNFRYNIAPVELTDKSLYIKGFMSGIRISGNVIIDSIRRNYHADMPDNSAVIPYASIAVAGERINIQFLQYSFITAWTKQTKNSIEPVNSITGIAKELLPRKDYEKFYRTRSIRVSINGKPLFNWKKLINFKKQLCKIASSENDAESSYGYEYVFSLCDTVININDQVFVEIKEDSSNQMVDSYNITRKTNAPKITAIVTVGKNDSVMADNNLPGEKKTLRSTPGPMK